MGHTIPEFPELPHRELLVPPYRFFHRVVDDTVWIVGVWHMRQLPDEPDVREFAGSLDEHGTDKGVFFTTDKFTGPALAFARSIKKHIVLIDGPELARLMVRHHVGVTATKTLPLTRLDSDYFDSGMEA